MRIGRFHLRSILAGSFRPAAVLRPSGPFRSVGAEGRIDLVVRPLLVDAPGERILFEAGFPVDLDADRMRRYGAGPVRPLDETLREAGIDPGTIDRLILSHLHVDHAGGAFRRDRAGRIHPALPAARIQVQRADVAAARESVEIGEPAGPYRREELNGLDSVGADRSDGATTRQPGLEIRLFGGHAPGMQGLVIEGGGETLIAPSDLLPTIAHLRIPGPAEHDALIETALRTRAWVYLY
ncbi:MAG: MBL fold metallo-hydrolase, partial [Candidatus Eisenbacteria bacterium]|nr:MBL fold metallo-hydrolase [Candidatus Latescibacterota bacterium]MBD3302438.1 MBL fold metallo-hydrolase [Candidatus Eisenbacteria bacterium]